MSTMKSAPVFCRGEEVVLAMGTYQGTRGVFICLSEDPAWAEITQRDGIIRSHPVAWLEHAARPAAGGAL